jgi:hypothetical protein
MVRAATKKIEDITGYDVLQKAIEIIESGDPPYEWSDCYECCPWCAIAEAHDAIQDEIGDTIPIGMALRDVAPHRFSVTRWDKPLIEARKLLHSWANIAYENMSKEEACSYCVVR